MHTSGMAILGPVVALAGWTMVMWVWVFIGRIPAIAKVPALNQPGADVGWTAAKLDKVLPPKAQWPAHNYNHLHEAPTVFYAVAITLAIVGAGDGSSVQLGWAYVGLRVAHSVWHATINKVMPRFILFILSSLVLMALIARAALAVF